MSDSSSDGEPLINSPCASDDDSDDDLFRYDKRKFIKTTSNQSDFFPTPARAQRKRLKSLSTDEQMSRLEKNQEKKQISLRARIDQSSILNDDSDESVDAVRENDPNFDPNASIEILDDATDRSTTRVQERIMAVVNLAESSDDDDIVAAARSQRGTPLSLAGASKEAIDAIQRSRQARAQLAKAQLYHAEDVVVDDRNVTEVSVPLTISQLQTYNMTAENLGETLQFTCNIKREINGKKQDLLERQYSIKENETVQILVDKILLSNSLPTTSRVKLAFGGIILEKHRTPAFYGMVDQAQLDIEITVNIAPTVSTGRAKSDFGPNLNLRLRSRVGKNVHEVEMQIGQREPLKRLLDSYQKQHNLEEKSITLHFDGEKLDMGRTPVDYDMETGELIDVICK